MDTIGWMALLLLPTFACMAFFVWTFERARARAKAPFTDKMLRPPGESTRLKIDDMSDKLNESVVWLLLPGPVSATMIATAPTSDRIALGGTFFALVVIVTFVMGSHLLRSLRRLRDYRLGFEGERRVGEALNQLLADGWSVFHDVPFEGYNIDHVVVGEPGVFAFETKTRRKPIGPDGKAGAKVVFVGERLHFPTWSDEHGLEQARRNAQSLAAWLGEMTATPTLVAPVLVLPGWFVERRANSDVTVINPKEVSAALRRRVPAPLDSGHVRRIAAVLREKCLIAET